MDEDVPGLTPYPDRQATVQFQHWTLFTNLVKQSQTPETTVKILCAVYSKHHDELLLPGSNLETALRQFDGPTTLSYFLRRSSPKLLGTDDFAGDVACRAILDPTQSWQDSILLAKMERPANASRVAVLRQDSIEGPERLSLSLEWPPEFWDRIDRLFPGESVWFSAFPLSVDIAGTRDPVEHVALVYFSQQDEMDLEDGRKWNWLRWLRELLLFGALTYLSEQLAIQEARLIRLRESEKTMGLTKINPPRDGTSLRDQAHRLKDLSTSKNLRRIIFPPVEVGSIEKQPPFYRMPKYDLPSLRHLLLAPTQPPKHHVIAIVRRLIKCLGMELYGPTKKDAGEAKAWGLKTAADRLSRMKEKTLPLLEQIRNEEPVELPSRVVVRKEQDAHKLLREILGRTLSKKLVVWDEHATPPSYTIDPKDVENAFLSVRTGSLDVSSICTIHGDLHFDNILVDAYFPEDPLFVLIDPSSKTDPGDPAFDVAKLLFSCHAAYDFIDTDNFDFNIVQDKATDMIIHMRIPELNLVHREMKTGGVASSLISKEYTLPKATPSLFQAAAEEIKSETGQLERRLGDSQIYNRACYYEAILCLTLSSVPIVENPRGALALTLRGLNMLKDWRATHT